MNAQAAIEIKAKELQGLIEFREEILEDGIVYYGNEIAMQEAIKRMDEEINTSSIILESAKKLHEGSLIRKFKNDNGLPMIHILHGNSYDKEEAKKIGIEVDAD